MQKPPLNRGPVEGRSGMTESGCRPAWGAPRSGATGCPRSLPVSRGRSSIILNTMLFAEQSLLLHEQIDLITQIGRETQSNSKDLG